MNELRKEYHNKTAGQIGEKARDLQTSYFTDEYVFWLEEQLKQLRIASVVKPFFFCNNCNSERYRLLSPITYQCKDCDSLQAK